MLLMATWSFALCYTAWSLVRPVGQAPWHHLDVGWRADVLLISAPAVLGSLGRIPVGALTDRFGPRIMLPAVGMASALAVLVLATANSRPVAVTAACALGVAGTAFPVGASLVASLYPLGRRGFAFSVYGAGMGGVAAGNLVSLRALKDHGTGALLVLATALIGCAVLAALVVGGAAGTPGRQERRTPDRQEGLLRTAVALIRLPATRYLSAWYALAWGGLVSFSLYLPSYLHGVYGLGWTPALSTTAAAVGIAAVACPVGGWLCGRRNPAQLLARSYGTAAAMALLVVFQLPKGGALLCIAAIAAGFGTVVGVILALIGRTAPTRGIGTITGTVGAAGGLAAMVGPMLLGAAYQRVGSFSIGWALLAGLALAAAAQVRSQRGYLRALAFPTRAPGDGHLTTVVTLGPADAARNTEGVLAALTVLAYPGHLAIVYGGRDEAGPGMTPHALVNSLRAQLPGRTVLAVYLDRDIGAGDSCLIAQVLDEGGVVVGYTPRVAPAALAGRLANRLGAHQLLRLTDHSIDSYRPLSLPWLVRPLVATDRAGSGRGPGAAGEFPRC